MNEKERLEGIKNRWKNGYPVNTGSSEESQLHVDFEWLIRQAEDKQRYKEAIQQAITHFRQDEDPEGMRVLEKALRGDTNVP